MRVSLSGVAKNAATVIEELLDALNERYSDEEVEHIESEIQANDSVFMLREVAEHAKETAEGQHTVDEFAKHYCLTTNE